MRLVAFVAPLALLLLASAARADFTATIESRMEGAFGGPGGDDYKLQAKLYVKGSRTRVELQRPMRQVSITDHATGKLLTLDDAGKTYSEGLIPARERAMSTTQCTGKDADACLAAQGFKKVGDGEANGRKCVVWERVADEGGRTTTRLFRPKGQAFPFFRMVVSTPDGGMTTDVVEAKEVPLDEALFTVPAGYKAAAAGGFPSREQIEALIKKYRIERPQTEE
jgi:hypothetical protein